MTYAERDGIGHVVQDGTAPCGAMTDEPVELDFEPRPLCWRCREAMIGLVRERET